MVLLALLFLKLEPPLLVKLLLNLHRLNPPQLFQLMAFRQLIMKLFSTTETSGLRMKLGAMTSLQQMEIQFISMKIKQSLLMCLMLVCSTLSLLIKVPSSLQMIRIYTSNLTTSQFDMVELLLVLKQHPLLVKSELQCMAKKMISNSLLLEIRVFQFTMVVLIFMVKNVTLLGLNYPRLLKLEKPKLKSSLMLALIGLLMKK